MKEFESFINSLKIDEEYHKKVFTDNLFERFYSKIYLKEFEKFKNEIYWISLLIFRCVTANYIEKEKLIPMNNSKEYYETYLKCVLTLLKDCLLILKKYDNNKLKVDFTQFNNINFIGIKSNKKGRR